jgi:DNA-binding transcriptional LysR family regulator
VKFLYNRQIQTFVYAAEYGSFSKAAEILIITPASVMNQINSLENRIGVKLLERTNQGIGLTPAGQSFYEDAKRIIEQSENAVNRARQIAGVEEVEKYVIRVGTSLLNPCKTLIDLWGEISDNNTSFQIKIVPFEDDHNSILSTISSLGKRFDFLVGACDSKEWLKRCNIFPLGTYDICCAVPRKHRLAQKKILQASDLYGENLMMVKRGDTDGLDALRDMLEADHPQIHITDTPFFYDAEVFNTCEQTGSVLLTLNAWAEIHPSLVTIPVKWDYKAPYGLLYTKNPSKDVLAFLEAVEQFGTQSKR